MLSALPLLCIDREQFQLEKHFECVSLSHHIIAVLKILRYPAVKNQQAYVICQNR